MLEGPRRRSASAASPRATRSTRAAAVLLDGRPHVFLVQAGGDLYVHGHKPDGRRGRGHARSARPGGHVLRDAAGRRSRLLDRGRLRAQLRRGRQALPPHHRSAHRLPGDRVAQRDHLGARTRSLADAIDDAVFILGPKKGLELVESIDDAGAIVVDRENKVWVSKRLEGKSTIERAPTGGI